MDTNHSPDASSSSQVNMRLLFGLFLGIVVVGLGLFSLHRRQAEQLRLFELARQAREAEAARQAQIPPLQPQQSQKTSASK